MHVGDTRRAAHERTESEFPSCICRLSMEKRGRETAYLLSLGREVDVGPNRASVQSLRRAKVVSSVRVVTRHRDSEGVEEVTGHVDRTIQQEPLDRLLAGGLRQGSLVRHVMPSCVWRHEFLDREAADELRTSCPHQLHR